mgnify:FL=1
MNRCGWVKMTNPLYITYHDQEWGKLLHDDRSLFELLCLEGYQAGLSWETILNKRQAFKEAFHNYDIDRVAQMSDEELDSLLDNSDIIRHRAKLYATRANAQAFQAIQEEFDSFDRYIWSYLNFTPLVNQVDSYKDLPAQNDLSQKIAKDLKKRGCKFVGPTTIYSFLEAAGLINDHENGCDFK